MKHFFKNYLSTILFLLIVYFFYSQIQYYHNFLIKDFNIKYLNISFNSIIIYKFIILSYIILLIPFYYKNKRKSKARIIIKYIIKKNKNIKYKIKKEELYSILSWLVKAFFAPLMIIWLTAHMVSMVNNTYSSLENLNFIKDFYVYFNTNLFYLIL
jgi:hypothetical protein